MTNVSRAGALIGGLNEATSKEQMKLPKLNAFLDSKISKMTAGDYVKEVNGILEEFKPFSKDVRRGNKELSAQMRSLKSQVMGVELYLKSGLPLGTKMGLVALMTNTQLYIQVERGSN